MHRSILIGIAAFLASVALALFGVQLWSAPTTLRIAVGPMNNNEDLRLVVAASQQLAREREPVRLKLVLTDGVAASADAVDEDKADLAIVRSDVRMPLKGQTVAIMHRDAALLMTTGSSGISKVSGLWGRNVGILRKGPANQRLLETVLTHYGVPHESVPTVLLESPQEVEEGLRSKRFDAVLVVGPVTAPLVTDTVAAVARAAEGSPVFIPIAEADAIAQRSPVFDELEVVRGTFGGSPPRPPDTIETLGVSHRLVAQAAADDGHISELTQLLFHMRPSLAKETPIANNIEEVDTAKGSALPVHPGAAAYYEGEVQTFFERYGDWFYLGVMVLSIIGSGLAGVASAASSRSRGRIMALLDELLGIIHKARSARTDQELKALEADADRVLAMALGKAGRDGVDQTVMVAMFLGLDQARRAIHEQRHILQGQDPALAQAAE
jgi:TRAP transporter TAXI family solute receptor